MLVHNNSLLLRFFGAILVLALASFSAAAHQAETTQSTTINPTLVTATGTVAELTVTNQLTGVTLRYFGLKVDQGGSYALTGTGLDTLSDGSRINVTGTLAGNIFNVTLSSSVAPADSAARATLQAKTKKTVSGTLAVYHKDFFQQGRGEYGLAVRDASGKPTQLNVAAIPDSLEIGMLITADGTLAADGSSLDTTSITILAPPAAMVNDIAAAPVTNTVLVIPIRFSDTPAGDPFNAAAINTEFQTHVGPYYQEVSYSQQLLNISVACTSTPLPAGCSGKTDANGWLQSTSPTPADCGFDSMGSLADAVATAAGYDTSVTNTKFVYYVLPSIPACGWAGLAYVGYGQAWSNGYNALWVYGHELGHNFGLWHSGSLTCPGQSIGPNCVGNYAVNEYGDPFDVMGNIYPGHFNSMQKSVLGWIPTSSVKTHTSGSATYTLSPLENSGQSTYAVKIPASTTPPRTYWIEYRQPIGVDSGIASSNGAQIRVAAPFQFPCTSCGGDDTQILDMTLGTPGNFGDAALLLNQTYADATYGISVTVTGVTTGPAGTLTLTVSAPGGGTATATTLVSSLNPSTVGASVTFTASVTGTAPTGSVNFTDGGTTISGCGAVVLTGAGNTRTAACSTAALSSGTHTIVAGYSGDGANNASSSQSLSQVVNKAGTTTALFSSANPSTVGTGVTFTASVTGNAPTGTLNFTDGGTTISGCGVVALTGGGNTRTAACSNSGLGAGTHSVVASYSGDPANTFSTSAVLSQLVNSSSQINVALASNGGVASASSTLSAAFPVNSINNNERAGVNWGNGGGWADGTPNSFPDWAQITFNGSKTIDHVVVYTVQDNWQNPIEPTDTMTFTTWGLTDFTVQGWNGTAWVTLGSVSGNNLVKRTVNFAAYTTDRIRINIISALNSYSRITEVEAWGVNGGGSNVALASNGGVASASSTYTQSGYSFPVAAINNNERAGTNWGYGGGWANSNANTYPDWVEIDFNGSKTIDHVIVYTMQDNYGSPVEPTDSMTFSLYGITDFTVQGWNGGSWVTLGTVSGNNLVKRTVNFMPYTTNRIRINITSALNGYSRITEVEAWGVNAGPPQINVALASNGGVASASSTYTQSGYSFPVAAINNNERAGTNWGYGGGWADSTANTYPDWVEIDFNGSKTIDHVIVYTMQDNYGSPVEPTDTMTFSLYGVTDFTVQGWSGGSWVTLGTVTGNNLVKRTVNFGTATTDRIRINVTNALATYSRITEVEAWGN
jgi:Bacterial Ig-like domain (group 3)